MRDPIFLTTKERMALRVVADRPHHWGHPSWLPGAFFNLSSKGLVQVDYPKDGRVKVTILPEGKQYLEDNAGCVCPESCDCESPDTNPALVSEACWEHNAYPRPVPGCQAKQHKNGAR